MHYLADRRNAYAHPENVLAGVQSIVLLALSYRDCEPRPLEQTDGRISRYAWGEVDYHDLIHDKLKRLKRFVEQERPGAKVRGVVDTAPLLERDFAVLAGLGWQGKHTLLINRDLGSWFFIAALLTDLKLTPDPAFETDHCGSCTACLDACPTDAFPQPYVLDARKCISYLTIELREAVPDELRAGMGDWLFGCDVCQDVCPWNRRSVVNDEDEFAPRDDLNPIDAAELLSLDDDDFRKRFRKTPLWRSKRRGLLRNAAIVLGNRRSLQGLAALCKAINDAEPLVRGAAAWAIGRYQESAATAALQARLAAEDDEEVRAEIESALGGAQP